MAANGAAVALRSLPSQHAQDAARMRATTRRRSMKREANSSSAFNTRHEHCCLRMIFEHACARCACANPFEGETHGSQEAQREEERHQEECDQEGRRQEEGRSTE